MKRDTTGSEDAALKYGTMGDFKKRLSRAMDSNGKLHGARRAAKAPHSCAKLTEAKVRKIRERLKAAGTKTKEVITALALEHHVSRSTIFTILGGITWRNVE